MPVKKGKSCWGDVMGEFKRGQLHSGTGKAGKKGKKVTNPQQAKAIAASTCDNNEMDDQQFMCQDGKCGKCPRCQSKQSMLAMGYSEEAIDAVIFSEKYEATFKEKKGLWANIHAKRERIKRGSGERMRKPGEKGAPSAADLKAAGADDKNKK